MEPGKGRSRVLVIGGTGHIGKHIVAASVRHGHSTSVLIRDATPSDPAKAQLLTSFIDSGVALVKVCVTIIPCELSFNYSFLSPVFFNDFDFPPIGREKEH
jgi:nucleoside-diphosphate-sugar epimerase